MIYWKGDDDKLIIFCNIPNSYSLIMDILVNQRIFVSPVKKLINSRIYLFLVISLFNDVEITRKQDVIVINHLPLMDKRH